MEEELKGMMDMTAGMMEIMIEDGKLFELTAKAVRCYYEELIKAGFSEEQAITIASNYSIK